MRRLLYLLVFAGILLFPASTKAEAACTSYLSPPQSSSQLGSAISGLAKGTTLCLRAGSYGSGSQVYVNPSSAGTSETDRRKVRGAPEDPIGSVTINGGVYFSASADYVTIRLLNVNGSAYTDDTIGLGSGANFVNLADLDVTNQKKFGIHGCITSGGSNLIVTRSRIHDCGGDTHFDHCVYLGHGSNAQVVSNVIFGCATWAIHLYPGTTNSFVHNNVLDSSGGDVLFGGGSSPCEATQNGRLENNTMTNSNGARDHDDAALTYWPCVQGSGTLKNNCFYANAFGDYGSMPGISVSGNVNANPQYTTGHHIPSTSSCYPLVGDPAASLLIPNP